MKLRTLAILSSAVPILFVSLAAAAAGEPLESYKITQVTETLNYDNDGRVIGKDVVRESRVDVRERVAERYVGDGRGGMRLAERSTTVQDTQGKVVTTVESRPNPEAGDLVVTSVTTSTRDAFGGSVTTTETRNADGELQITGRIAVKREGNRTVTTVEALGKDGDLVITSQTTAR